MSLCATCFHYTPQVFLIQRKKVAEKFGGMKNVIANLCSTTKGRTVGFEIQNIINMVGSFEMKRESE